MISARVAPEKLITHSLPKINLWVVIKGLIMEYTKEYFDKYLELIDGKLYWKPRDRSEFSCDRIWKSTNSRISGKIAEKEKEMSSGCIRSFVNISGKRFLTHRVIFCMHHGYMPKLVDHIDMNTTNNKIENLREANHSQNGANASKRKINSTGYKGVSLHRSSGLFRVRIKVKYKEINGGYFKCKHEAALKYNQLATEHYGEFARLNEVNL